MKYFPKKNSLKKKSSIIQVFKKFSRNSKTITIYLFLEGHTSWVSSVVVTSDNKYIVSGSWDKTIRIWNLLEKRQETVLQGHTDSVWTVAVTSDNKYIVSGSRDKTIRIWNLLEKKQETVSQGHTSCVNSVAVTSDNKYIISGSKDKTIRIWKF